MSRAFSYMRGIKHRLKSMPQIPSPPASRFLLNMQARPLFRRSAAGSLDPIAPAAAYTKRATAARILARHGNFTGYTLRTRPKEATC